MTTALGFWGVSGIHVIDYLPLGTSFDFMYFINHILCGFNTLPIINVAVKQKKRLRFTWTIRRCTNQSVICKISSMPVQLGLHPPYSPDLTPSDFSYSVIYNPRWSDGYSICLRTWSDGSGQLCWGYPGPQLSESLTNGSTELRDVSQMKVAVFLRSKKWLI
jgi:hypothetical protein